MAGEGYPFETLMREIVVSRLRGAKDAPEQAAKIAVQAIVVGIKGTQAAGAKQSPAESVRKISQGIIEGMVLLDGDVASTVVEILRRTADAGNQVSLDPADMMTWVMEGIAANAKILTPQQMNKTHDAIDVAFMGAGQVFINLAEKAKHGNL